MSAESLIQRTVDEMMGKLRFPGAAADLLPLPVHPVFADGGEPFEPEQKRHALEYITGFLVSGLNADRR